MGLGWPLAVAQGYDHSCNIIGLWCNFQRNLKSCGIELGLGWLRAVAQCYSYSYNKIELESKVHKNLKSWVVTFCWGLDCGARRRKVTVTVAIQLVGIIFKRI